jgi:hypothetical protein
VKARKLYHGETFSRRTFCRTLPKRRYGSSTGSPGVFTEFVITLLRDNDSKGNYRDATRTPLNRHTGQNRSSRADNASLKGRTLHEGNGQLAMGLLAVEIFKMQFDDPRMVEIGREVLRGGRIDAAHVAD